MEHRPSGEVIHIDRFGNLTTNIRRTDWDAQGIPDHCQATCGTDHAVGLQNTYSEADPQTPVILFGSSGFLEFSIVNGNAAQQLGARVKTVVQLDWSP